MRERYYAAYGSNLNISQMRMRCPSAKVVGSAKIRDYELLFKGSHSGSYLTIEPKDGASVPVGIWKISSAEEKALDRYEGFPQFYYKVVMNIPVRLIRTDDVRWRDIFVYVMHEDRGFGIPSRQYMETCIDGFRAFGFDEDELWRAYDRSREGVKENERENLSKVWQNLSGCPSNIKRG